MKIIDYLGTGRQNAKTASQIAKEMHLDRKDVYNLLDAARRAGQPICDSISSRPVFWLASTRAEMLAFCMDLEDFEKALSKTRKLCMKSLVNLEN